MVMTMTKSCAVLLAVVVVISSLAEAGHHRRPSYGSGYGRRQYGSYGRPSGYGRRPGGYGGRVPVRPHGGSGSLKPPHVHGGSGVLQGPGVSHLHLPGGIVTGPSGHDFAPPLDDVLGGDVHGSAGVHGDVHGSVSTVNDVPHGSAGVQDGVPESDDAFIDLLGSVGVQGDVQGPAGVKEEVVGSALPHEDLSAHARNSDVQKSVDVNPTDFNLRAVNPVQAR